LQPDDQISSDSPANHERSPAILDSHGEREAKERARLESDRQKTESEHRLRELEILANQGDLLRRQNIMLGVSVVLSLAAVVFSGIQAREARRSAAAAAESNNLTREAVELSKAQLAESRVSSAESARIARESHQASITLNTSNLDQGRRALQAAIDASILDQRPWVTVSGVELVETLDIGALPRARIHFINSGKTPALDFASSSNVVVRSRIDAIPPPSHPGTPRTSNAVMGPGVPKFILAECDEPVRRQEQIDAIARNAAQIYVTGYITYKDTFGKERSTAYCFLSNGQKDERGKFELFACDRWNTAN